MRPKAVLLDYSGTLVEELGYDPRQGAAWLLTRAAFCPPHVTLDDVVARAAGMTAVWLRPAGAAAPITVEPDPIADDWPALVRLADLQG